MGGGYIVVASHVILKAIIIMKAPTLTDKFNELKASGGKAFIPYIMAGDPNLEATLRYIKLLEECGADIIELGVPFSDPLADGPTIQAAAERALRNGITLKKILTFLKTHCSHIRVPIVLMTYYNPIFKYGEEEFLRDAAMVGVRGMIIPDLTAEESDSFVSKARQYNIDTIFLIAPTSTKERVQMIVSLCRGFVYYVSITGITGSKLSLPEQFYRQLETIRSYTDLPIAVGFGVSTPEEARLIAGVADAVIVGSAIVKRLNTDPVGVTPYIRSLRVAIRN